MYAWQCQKCGKEDEGYLASYSMADPPCPCGGPRDRIWRVTRHHATSIFPYVTSNITGSPVEVTSQSHLDSLCKAAGVTHRPDVAWIEKEMEATPSGPKWREGSGRGLPGSWV